MLKIDIVKNKTGAELIMVGKLDARTAPDADAIFKDASERFSDLTLNLGKLEYVSSAGLRALKHVNLAMRRKGGTLVLKNVTKGVMEVLEITGFVAMFKYA